MIAKRKKQGRNRNEDFTHAKFADKQTYRDHGLSRYFMLVVVPRQKCDLP